MPRFRPAIVGLLLGAAALAQTAGVVWPDQWTLFGTVTFDAPAPAPGQLRSVPASLHLGETELAGREVRFPADGLNLGELFGGHQRGDTAYLFGVLHAERASEIPLGAGADWWMAWWLNGEPVYDTLEDGNGPAGIVKEAHVFTLRLQPGANVLAVRVSGGRQGFFLTAGLPAPERAEALLREHRQQARVEEVRDLLATADERLRRNDSAGARTALAEAFERGDLPPPAALSLRLLHLGLLERDGLLDEACAEAARLLESECPPWAEPVLLARLGRLHLAQGRRAEAAAAYKAILALPAAHPRTVEQANGQLAKLAQ